MARARLPGATRHLLSLLAAVALLPLTTSHKHLRVAESSARQHRSRFRLSKPPRFLRNREDETRPRLQRGDGCRHTGAVRCNAVIFPDQLPHLVPLSPNHILDVASAAAAAGGATVDYQAIFKKAASRALGGGTSGALAGVAQVLSLMWLRTAMNYQYRYGTSTTEAITTLWKEGGVRRFYQGLGYALVQNPLSRFGDTAANAGILVALEAIPEAQSLPFPLKQAIASAAASTWRIAITPIDTYKTALQVNGEDALERLGKKVEVGGPGVLWNGAFAAAAATFVGNYPWFLTYNSLDSSLPQAPEGDVVASLVRRAFIGIIASGVSDTTSNSLRVIKTTKQTSQVPISYADAVKEIVDKDGLPGLFGRGLQTRLLVNCLQGALFSVVWKAVESKIS